MDPARRHQLHRELEVPLAGPETAVLLKLWQQLDTQSPSCLDLCILCNKVHCPEMGGSILHRVLPGCVRCLSACATSSPWERKDRKSSAQCSFGSAHVRIPGYNIRTSVEATSLQAGSLAPDTGAITSKRQTIFDRKACTLLRTSQSNCMPCANSCAIHGSVVSFHMWQLTQHMISHGKNQQAYSEEPAPFHSLSFIVGAPVILSVLFVPRSAFGGRFLPMVFSPSHTSANQHGPRWPSSSFAAMQPNVASTLLKLL